MQQRILKGSCAGLRDVMSHHYIVEPKVCSRPIGQVRDDQPVRYSPMLLSASITLCSASAFVRIRCCRPSTCLTDLQNDEVREAICTAGLHYLLDRVPASVEAEVGRWRGSDAARHLQHVSITQPWNAAGPGSAPVHSVRVGNDQLHFFEELRQLGRWIQRCGD